MFPIDFTEYNASLLYEYSLLVSVNFEELFSPHLCVVLSALSSLNSAQKVADFFSEWTWKILKPKMNYIDANIYFVCHRNLKSAYI